MAFLSFFHSINKYLFVLSKCSFSIDTQTGEVHTTKTHVALFALIIVGFEAFLMRYGRINYQNYAMFNNNNNNLSGYSLYVIVNLIAHSHTFLSIQSLLMRHRQIQLLRHIDKFDRYFLTRCPCNVDVGSMHALRPKAFLLFAIFISFNLLTFVSEILMQFRNDFDLISFFLCYFLSDLCFTATIMNACFYGYFLVDRYKTLSAYLYECIGNRSPSMRKRLNELLIFDYQVLDIKLKITDVFGLSLAHAVAIHSIVLALQIYIGIISLESRLNQSHFYLIAFFMWVTPYCMRIGLLVHAFAPIAAQVSTYTTLRYIFTLF